MLELLEESQIIHIADNNPNLIPVAVVILAIIYILYAMVSISYNKKRMRKLQRIKKKIQIRHDIIRTENERRKRLERQNNL